MIESSSKPHPRQNVQAAFRPADWFLNGPHRPPNDTVGEAGPDAILTSVGYVMSAWESLETMLSQFFVASMKGGDPMLLSAIYGSTASFSGRLDMLKKATGTGLDPKYAKGHGDLMGDLQRAASLRNLVAHSILAVRAPGEIYVIMPLRNVPLPEGHGYQLITAPYNSSKTAGWMNPVTYYASNTIFSIAHEIAKLMSRVTGVLAGEPQELKTYIRFTIS